MSKRSTTRLRQMIESDGLTARLVEESGNHRGRRPRSPGLRQALQPRGRRPLVQDRQLAQIRAQVRCLGAQQRELVTTTVALVDVLALLLGLTTAWANASPALRSLADQPPWDPERLRAHRTAMIVAAQALTEPPSTQGNGSTGGTICTP